MSKRVVIIGNGISGITAARYIRKWSDYNITVISAETEHFYSRTALMYIYMGHMRYEDTKPYEDFFWAKNRIELIRDYVHAVNTDTKELNLGSGRTVPYDTLVLGVGSKSRFFGWPGQELKGVQGLYGITDLENMEAYTQGIERAVVVGGGLIGIEMAEMLHSRHIPVTFLVREKSYFNHVLPPEESQIINQEILDHHIDLRLQTELKEAQGDSGGRVKSIITNQNEEIPCQFLGLTTGVTPNIDVVQRSNIDTNRGILINEFFETNIPDVYAIGDCAEFKEDGIGYRRLDQLWYTGRNHGKAVARIICGERSSYKKPLFFNSAKFFSIEYQTYGSIDTHPGDDISSLLWQRERRKELIRINYRKADNVVIGFNLLGIRFRHALCEKWILEAKKVPFVLENLSALNFDPEFYTQYEKEFVAQYNRLNPGTPITMKPARGLFSSVFN